MTTTRHELTAREGQVMALVADGLTNEQVGNRLGISSQTVQTHLKRICRVLKARNRTHATALYTRAAADDD
jgi:DNA-binding CsgD family transcriptional regulator